MLAPRVHVAAFVVASAGGLGCWVTHVAGVVDDASGGGSGSGGMGEGGGDADGGETTAEAATGSGTASVLDTSGDDGESGVDETTASVGSSTDDGTDACDLPPIDPDCDADGDPLRAFELACHGGVSSQAFESPDVAAWRWAHEYGNAFYAPRFGTGLLAMSTGVLPEADPSGQIALDAGAAQPGSANDNPDDATLPAPIVPEPGSNGGAGGAPFFDCDGIGDCSESLPPLWQAGGAAHDLVSWSAELAVPATAERFELDVAWLTAEFPERVGADANDTFVLWLASEAFTGNVATLQGQPVTATGLAALLVAHTLDDPRLLRTGVDGGTGRPCVVDGERVPSCPVGAATDWLTLVAPVHDREVVTIAAALFDQGDDGLDSIVLLDHFRWGCDPCTPGSDCGLQEVRR